MLNLWRFILCFSGDISWQTWRMKCWQGCASPFHSWKKKVSFYPRWRDSNLIRFTANLTPWASFLSSVRDDGQTGSKTVTETFGPHFDLTHKPNLWHYWHWSVVFRDQHFSLVLGWTPECQVLHVCITVPASSYELGWGQCLLCGSDIQKDESPYSYSSPQ